MNERLSQPEQFEGFLSPCERSIIYPEKEKMEKEKREEFEFKFMMWGFLIAFIIGMLILGFDMAVPVIKVLLEFAR